jgi:hypothetical protein
MTIVDAVPSEPVRIRLEFEEPMAAQSMSGWVRSSTRVSRVPRSSSPAKPMEAG